MSYTFANSLYAKMNALKKEMAEKEHKMCRGCNVFKPFAEFYKDLNGKYGLKGKCKVCTEGVKNVYKKKVAAKNADRDIVKNMVRDIFKRVIANAKNDDDYIVHKMVRCIFKRVVENEKQKKSSGTPLTYEKVYELVESKGCKLLVTKGQFQEHQLNSKSMYDIIALCGHKSKMKYDMFKAQDGGLYCIDCTRKNIREKLLVKASISTDTEYEGFCYARTKLEEIGMTVVKMVEGTRADFAIKPKKTEEDAWLPVQLKTTMKANEKYSNNYSFSYIRNTDYDGIAILLVCISDKRSWLIPADDIGKLNSIRIGAKRSRYSQYELTDQNWSVRWENIYDQLDHKKLDVLNTPINTLQQREQAYRRMREQYLPFLTFDYPEREGLAYDFKVNGWKIQEKVASYVKRRKSYFCQLTRNSRSKGYRKYQQGDNDFYWIQIPDSKIFYIFPETALIEQGKISTNSKAENNKYGLFLSPDYPNWMKKYEYNYDNIDIDAMQRLFAHPQVHEIPSISNETITEHRRLMAGRSLGKKIIRISEETKERTVYISVAEAARQNNIHTFSLSKLIKNNKIRNGYKYFYEE